MISAKVHLSLIENHIQFFKNYFLGLGLVMISGCDRLVSDFKVDIDQQILPPPNQEPLLVKDTFLENVTAGTAYATTSVSGFKVRQNVGVLMNKQLSTTPTGYKVFVNLSGRMAAVEANR